MKKLIFLLITFCCFDSIGQTLTNYKGKSWTATDFINSPVYKLSGVDLDSANTVKKGFFTKFQYSRLNTAFNRVGMVYPASGIPLSTGSAWGTSITNNSNNWNTAYGWGNHAGLYTPISHKTTEDAINGIVKVNGVGTYSAIIDNSANWNNNYKWRWTGVGSIAGAYSAIHRSGRVSIGIPIDTTYQLNIAGDVNITGSYFVNGFKQFTATGDPTYSTFFGVDAGTHNADGDHNTMIGYNAGHTNSYGTGNTLIGSDAGFSLGAIKSANTFVGSLAGNLNDGDANTFIGNCSGMNCLTGTGNIFLGKSSGRYETGSNILIISNQDYLTESISRKQSLIYGKFDADTLKQSLDINGNLDVSGLCHFGTPSNYTSTESDGTLVFTGNATVWDDLFTSIAAAKIPASNYPDWTAFTANTNAYTFKLNDYVDLETVELSHRYKEGTDLEVHLHLATNGTNTNARKVKYIIYYTYGLTSPGMHQFTAEANMSAELTIAANTPDKSACYLTLGTIPGTGLKIGTQLKMRIKRIAGTGTEPTGDPFLGMVGVHFEIDTEGSRTMNAK